MLDGDDFYIDLLLFHRRMRPLVVIDLKIDDFKPAYSGFTTSLITDDGAKSVTGGVTIPRVRVQDRTMLEAASRTTVITVSQWAIYADLERALTTDEQRAVSAALDAIVPDSGCVGPNRKGIYEVYFTVDAATRPEAETAAAQLMKAMLQQARVTVPFVLEVTALR